MKIGFMESTGKTLMVARKPGRFGKIATISAIIAAKAEAAGESVFAVFVVECGQVEFAPAIDEIIGNQDAADGAKQRAVADEPGEDVTGWIGDELPGHHQDADKTSDVTADAE